MHAMRCYPEERAAFQSQRGADGQEILHPLGSFVTAVREQAVIPHADAEASGNPPQEKSHCQPLPGEHKERNDCAYVECGHETSGHPADWFAKCSVLGYAHGLGPLCNSFLGVDPSVAAVMAGDCNTCVIREVCASYRRYKGTKRGQEE